jgi:mono/diheme cytochrome c family protein
MTRFQRVSEDINRVPFLLVGIAAMLLAGVVILASSQAAAQSRDNGARTTASTPTGNAQNGKMIYMKNGCWECHGRDAQSGRPALGPPAMPFPAFFNQLRKPREDMPPYTAKVLSDAEVADIYAFVQLLPQPPKAESVPLLQ